MGDGAVTEAKIANLAITAGKIDDGAITETKIGSNAVTGAKILNGAVVADKLGTGAVTAGKIGAGAVNNANYLHQVLWDLQHLEQAQLQQVKSHQGQLTVLIYSVVE
ncbi:hypothetical protein ABES23_13915 [Peribacillus frigoritolerans]|uniref:hypothetical protein n=1 Tax=Peribacillus frigoritolerans TaxID=450367 RepID=UPI000BBA324C|nr:hypothetical protein CMV16_25415 [Peribacillus simplex]